MNRLPIPVLASRTAFSAAIAVASAACAATPVPIDAPNIVRQNATSLACYAQAASIAVQMLARKRYRTLYRFGNDSDAQQPKAGLIDVDGTLYSTSCVGGAGRGSVFSVSTSGAEKVLYRFGGGSDGYNPWAGLVAMNGKLYGTTDLGGYPNGGAGTVFSVTMRGKEKILHSFSGHSDGAFPVADLVAVNGVLYGTTQEGGSYNGGTVFKITPRGTETVIHSFGGSTSSGAPDGSAPVGGLIYVNGLLYGTTASGGSYSSSYGNGYGTIFSISTGGNEHVLFNFDSYDGAGPWGDLTYAKKTLYGVSGGGAGGWGTVFSITTTGTEKVLYSFDGGPDGGGPTGGVIYRRGLLYGMTAFGGYSPYKCFKHDSCGTLFSVDANTGEEKILHRFGVGSDGANPAGRLLEVKGTLYGVTKNGGLFSDTTSNAGNGTVFALRL